MAKKREKVSVPPDAAKEIFDVVRLLPPALHLKDIEDLRSMIDRPEPYPISKNIEGRYGTRWLDGRLRIPVHDADPIDAEWLQQMPLIRGFRDLVALEVCLEGLPSAFARYVDVPIFDLAWLREYEYGSEEFLIARSSFTAQFAGDDAESRASNFSRAVEKHVLRYKQASEWYFSLYEFAQFLRLPGGWDRTMSRSRLLQRIGVDFGLDKDDGSTIFELSGFAKAFTGIPPERIKLCDNCGRVFWVRRTDAKLNGCSKECAKVLRTRRWREKLTPEKRNEYKFNRIKRDKGE